MISVATLAFGDARADIVSALAVIMGRDKAEAWMRSLEQKIREEAGEGAEAKVKPWLYAALGLGGAGVLIGLVALSRRR